MGYARKLITALIEVEDRERATGMILEAFRRAKCLRSEAARILGCDRETLAIWVRRLALEAQLTKLEAQAKRQGWHHGRVGGRPSKPKAPKVPATT